MYAPQVVLISTALAPLGEPRALDVFDRDLEVPQYHALERYVESEKTSEATIPKGPCRYMAYTWALKGVLYHGFGAYVCTIIVFALLGIKDFYLHAGPELLSSGESH